MTTTPTPPEGLPNLPERHGFFENDQMTAGYTAKQMVAYAVAAIAAQPQQAIPGWRLVPIEPTPEMLAATDIEDTEYYFHSLEGAHRFLAEHYRAMFASAPLPPPQKNPDDLDSGVGGGVKAPHVTLTNAPRSMTGYHDPERIAAWNAAAPTGEGA